MSPFQKTLPQHQLYFRSFGPICSKLVIFFRVSIFHPLELSMNQSAQLTALSRCVILPVGLPDEISFKCIKGRSKLRLRKPFCVPIQPPLQLLTHTHRAHFFFCECVKTGSGCQLGKFLRIGSSTKSVLISLIGLADDDDVNWLNPCY